MFSEPGSNSFSDVVLLLLISKMGCECLSPRVVVTTDCDNVGIRVSCQVRDGVWNTFSFLSSFFLEVIGGGRECQVKLPSNLNVNPREQI